MKKFSGFLFCLLISAPVFAADLTPILGSEHRSEANKNRDDFRHPTGTLEFFRLSPDMTVVEIWPGGGWYTEILAPYLKDRGTFYAAHFPADSEVSYFNTSRGNFEQKLAADPENYEAVILSEFNPAASILSVPEGSADRVLTFRNVHNWLRSNSEQDAFRLFYSALKPGGMLGVVEHRRMGDVDRMWMLENGYMTEKYVIELAENAGFQLLESSEINSNPEDSANHPKGVWTLPPRLRLGEENRATYLAIGESDRMTLLFIKPE